MARKRHKKSKKGLAHHIAAFKKEKKERRGMKKAVKKSHKRGRK